MCDYVWPLNLKKNEMNFIMQFFKYVEKQTPITVIAFFNLSIFSPEQ